MNNQHVSQGETVCFKVTNYEDAYASDVDVITKLEARLVEAGLIPVKIDWNTQVCCVEVVLDHVSLDSIDQIFKSLGLDSYFQEIGPKKEKSYKRILKRFFS